MVVVLLSTCKPKYLTFSDFLLLRLPSKIKFSLQDVTKKTKKNKKITVNLAINYGSRDEIVNACIKIKNKISIQSLSRNLYTKSF